MPQITDENRKWWVLAAMGGVMSIILLDETVVGVALPTLSDDLKLDAAASHWVINSYLLVFTCLAAAGGKLGDLFGLRAPFLVGAAIFGLASLVCGFAGSEAFIIGARALQGVGAAIVFPISFAMITRVFPPEQRGLAFGIYSAIGTAALALGPLTGGFFTDVLSWRWIFWINPPIVVLISGLIVLAWHKEPRSGPVPRFDLPGLITLSGGLGLLVLALMQGPEWGWGRPAILGAFAVGLLLLALFRQIERRVKAPLLDLALFASPAFTVGNLVIFTGQFIQMSVVIFAALYFQDVLHMDPLEAGLALLAGVAMAPLAAVPTGHLADRIGARPVALGGLVLGLVGFLWIGMAVQANSYLWIVPGLIAWGLANCPLFVAPRRVIMNSIATDKQGQSGGITMTAQLLGGTLGVAIPGAVFAMTDSYQALFFTTAGLCLLTLILTWIYIFEADRAAPT